VPFGIDRGVMARNALLALAVIGTLVLVWLALRPPTPAGAVAVSYAGGPSALFVTGGTLDERMTSDVAHQLRWNTHVVVRDGSGLTRAAVPGDAALGPALRGGGIPLTGDVIVVQGGEVDAHAQPATITVGTVHLVDYLITYKPAGTVLVLVGPIPKTPALAAGYSTVDGVMAQVATGRHLPYVDPVAEGWTTTDPDLAEKLAARLRAAAATAPVGREVMVEPTPAG